MSARWLGVCCAAPLSFVCGVFSLRDMMVKMLLGIPVERMVAQVVVVAMEAKEATGPTVRAEALSAPLSTLEMNICLWLSTIWCPLVI